MRHVVVSLTLICLCMCAGAQDAKPYLRLETGTHTARTSRIDTDTAQRFLVSASDDKTARVWDVQTGKLLKILRPPIGDSNEGMLYAVAVSPDGRSVALGGFTGAPGSFKASIYIFDRESGAIRKTITGLPYGTSYLAYSRNGQYLAALSKTGLQIYSTGDYTEVARDTDYGDYLGSVEFDSTGRLVTASMDGYVRLYSSDFRLLHKEKPSGGKRPLSASFSSNGNLIAVGLQDAVKVDVFSGQDLKFQFSVEAPSSNTNLAKIAWSRDGEILCATGHQSGQEPGQVYCWSDRGKGVISSLLVSRNSVSSLRMLDGGGIAFAGANGAVGIVDPKGMPRWRAEPKLLDFEDALIKISPDGNSIESSAQYFDVDSQVQHTVRFSAQERKLEIDPRPEASLAGPVTTGISVDGWKKTRSPVLNGKPLGLKARDMSWSLAIAPGQQGFILGAGFYIYRFDREGQRMWNTSVPAVALSVNISADGRFVVAALADGTLRWYTFEKGEEVLALFIDHDLKRWITWTPGGYYDASPGGEELIGWHVNNGPDKAGDFYPASRFRESRYRPDVVSKVLTTLNGAEAVRLADAERGKAAEITSITKTLPPVITIISPEDGTRATSTAVTLEYAIRTPSGEPVTRIRVLIDGRPAQGTQASKTTANSEQQAITVTIPERDSQVSLIAENRFSASVPASVRLIWGGTARGVVATPNRDEEFTAKPKLYVLAVGESNYQKPELKLSFPAKDAKDFAEAMSKQKGSLYRDVEIKLLPDAAKDDIEDGLDWLQHQVTSRDIGMLFLAGHGVNDSTNVYYFLPANADLDRLKRTGLVFSDIKTTMENIPGKVVMFVDTCHSGNVMGTRRGGSMDINGLVNELASAENGVVVFAASTGRQYSLEDSQWQNGAFTKALVEGLGGKAAYTEGNGKITVNMLDVYISERVKELTKGQQTPATTKPVTVPDFPVAVKH